jgi:uncharacterized protein YjbI with pentapeptide repeats
MSNNQQTSKYNSESNNNSNLIGPRADLKGKNLKGRNLTFANLEGAHLENADLKKANLTLANLEGAHLEGAHLENANLFGAKLRGAHLERANLTGANLMNVDIEGVDLKGVIMDDEQRQQIKYSLLRTSRTLGQQPDRMAQVSGEIHAEANLRGADLRGKDLRGVDLRKAHLEDAQLEGAYLEGAHLEGAFLEGAFLIRAYLEGAHLEGAHLERADLTQVNLQDAHLEGAFLNGTILREAYLEGAHLEGADLRYAHLENAHLERVELQNANMFRTNLSEAYLEDAVLFEAILTEAFLGGAHLERADLRNTKLISAFLEGAHLEGADLRGAHLQKAYMTKTNLRGAQLDKKSLNMEQKKQIIMGDARDMKQSEGRMKELQLNKSSARSSSLTWDKNGNGIIINIPRKLLQLNNKSSPDFKPLYDQFMVIDLDGIFRFQFRSENASEVTDLTKIVFDKLLTVYIHLFFVNVREFILLKIGVNMQQLYQNTEQIIKLAKATNSQIKLKINRELIEFLSLPNPPESIATRQNFNTLYANFKTKINAFKKSKNPSNTPSNTPSNFSKFLLINNTLRPKINVLSGNLDTVNRELKAEILFRKTLSDFGFTSMEQYKNMALFIKDFWNKPNKINALKNGQQVKLDLFVSE